VTSRRVLDGVGAQRVHRRERDQHVPVRGGLLGDLLAGQRPVPGGGPGVHGEYHRRHVQRPVQLGDLLKRRRAVVVGPEVPGRGGDQLVVQRVMPVAIGLDVHVDVDGGQRIGAHSWHCTCPTT
jgi:hypothetical protein